MKILNPQSPITKATLLLASTLTVMAGATIAPSLPAMRDYFIEVKQVELWVRLVLTIPALLIVISSPITGTMVDKLGRKPLLIVSTLLYGIAGSSGFILNSLDLILISRAFLGLGVAGIMVSATTLIADYYTGQARANFMGLQAAFMNLGGVIFLSTGGYLADVNWRLPFLIYLFAWLLIPLMIVSLSEPNFTKKIDSSVVTQTSGSIPIKLLIFVYGILIITQGSFYLIPVQLPFHLQDIFNAQAKDSGLAIAFSTFFSAIASMNYGKVKERWSYINLLILTLVLMGCGFSIIGLANNYLTMGLGLGILGSGLGLLMPHMTVWVSAEVPDSVRGRALGGLTTSIFLGQFLSPLVAQPLNQIGGLGMTFVVAGGMLLLFALVFWQRKRQILKYIGCSSS